jgi:poly(A) polymerase
LRWALLLHDVAKPDTLDHDEEGRPTFHGHEPLGGRRADSILRRLRQPRAFRKRVSLLVRYHLRPHHLAEAGAPARGMRRLVREAAGVLPLLLVLAACDAKASGAPDARTRWRRLRPVLSDLLAIHDRSLRRPLPRLVSGQDVMKITGVPPGPRVGRALQEIRELQEGGVLRDREQALEYLVKHASVTE